MITEVLKYRTTLSCAYLSARNNCTREFSNRVARERDVRVGGVVFLDGSEVHKVEVVERTLRNMGIELCANITLFRAVFDSECE